MPLDRETAQRLAHIPNLAVSHDTLLSQRTRFAIGGPAEIYAETADEHSFIQALNLARSTSTAHTVIGGGTNLIVSDSGFPGIVLRFTGSQIRNEGAALHVEGGAELQALVDYSIDRGLRGIETMTGIPGSVGAAIYG